MRESKIEAHLVKVVEALGGEVRKLKWIGRKSAPDRIVMHPDYRCFVELKATGKYATHAQEREHQRMRNMGETIVVFNSIEQIDNWFRPRTRIEEIKGEILRKGMPKEIFAPSTGTVKVHAPLRYT